MTGEMQMAQKRQVSTTGRLMKYILQGLHVLPDLTNEKTYQRAITASQKPYRLAFLNRLLFGAIEYNGRNDVLEISPKYVDDRQLIFYLHGGGYWDQPSIMHYRLLKKLADQTQHRIIMPIYPKAPQHQAQETIQWTKDAFLETLEKEQIGANQIVLMGDSAGAGLALSLLQQLRDAKLALPKQLILISPWFDISDTNHEMKAVQPFDPMLEVAVLDIMATGYQGELDLDDPLISSLYADFANMPAINVITGTYDVLHPDAVKFQEIADDEGWDVHTTIYPEMYHDFPEIPIPEGKAAIQQMVQLIKER